MISPKQKKILAFPYSKYDALICDGAVRSGKTSIMMVAFVDWAMREFNGTRFGICGKTVDSATKNIIVPYISMSYAKERYKLRWRRSDKLLEVKRGAVTNWFEVFGGKDESSYALIQGRTLGGVLLDEVALMPKSFVDQALARCSLTKAKVWFSCNPRGSRHWFYQEWILKAKERNALRLHFEMTDNPSMPKEVLDRYQRTFSGVFYDWYVRGLWVDPSGLVYQLFDRDKHITRETPWLDELGNTKPGVEYYVSIDYGTLNPFSAGLWAVYSGVAYRVKEYYYSGRETRKPRTDEEHYQAIEKMIRDLSVAQIVIDPSAASFIETIRRHDKYSVKKANNDVLNGINVVANLLQAGRLKIHQNCQDCIREFETYAWATDKNEMSQEMVVKENDHAMDDTRYFCNTILRREFDYLNWRDGR